MKSKPSSESLGDAAKLRVLAYHEIGNNNSKDIYTLAPEDFIQHLWVISGVLNWDASSKVSVTFDDGHRSNLDFAAPLLEMENMQGHFFLTPSWISSRDSYLTWEDVRTLAKRNHVIGSHSDTHVFLTRCSSNRLKEELHGSRMKLEDGIGAEVTTISMPGGRWNRDVLKACSTAGYKTVYTSEPGVYQPPRIVDGQQIPEVIGRFAVRRLTDMRTLSDYCSCSRFTTKYLNSVYHVRRSIRCVIGDGIYQKLWTRLFRGTYA